MGNCPLEPVKEQIFYYNERIQSISDTKFQPLKYKSAVRYKDRLFLVFSIFTGKFRNQVKESYE